MFDIFIMPLVVVVPPKKL